MISDRTFGGQLLQNFDPRMSVDSGLPALPIQEQVVGNVCKPAKSTIPGATQTLLNGMGAGSVWQALGALQVDIAGTVEGMGPAFYCIPPKDLYPSPDKLEELAAASIWTTGLDPAKDSIAFQIYGFAFSAQTTMWADRGVQIADPKSPPPDIPTPPFIASAAEYYFHCDDRAWSKCAGDSLFAPRWSARLRRIHRPDDGHVEDLHLLDIITMPSQFAAQIPGQVRQTFDQPQGMWDRVAYFIH
jgi:hypothetical protein